MSRKFIVWLAWTVLAVAAIFVHDLPKDNIYSFYGLVSLIYIGANVYQKQIFNKKEE